MKAAELCDNLDHLEYQVEGMASAISGVRRRIVDEWINHKPLKTYGRPSVVLSKPLTKAQVTGMLSQYSDNIQGYAEVLTNLSNQLSQEE